jgi:diguanylate cyclase (GGDEF)-like protein
VDLVPLFVVHVAKHRVGLEQLGQQIDVFQRRLEDARWGGEEFVVVLPGADTAAALAIGERIREMVASHGFELGGDRVTCSIGVASVPADGLSREEIVQAADHAMYVAKARGGDQVTAAHGRLDPLVKLVD